MFYLVNPTQPSPAIRLAQGCRRGWVGFCCVFSYDSVFEGLPNILFKISFHATNSILCIVLKTRPDRLVESFPARFAVKTGLLLKNRLNLRLNVAILSCLLASWEAVEHLDT